MPGFDWLRPQAPHGRNQDEAAGGAVGRRRNFAAALQDEFGRVPTEEEVDRMFHLTRVMWKAVLGLHYKRKEQKKSGQLAIF